VPPLGCLFDRDPNEDDVIFEQALSDCQLLNELSSNIRLLLDYNFEQNFVDEIRAPERKSHPTISEYTHYLLKLSEVSSEVISNFEIRASQKLEEYLELQRR